MAALKVFKSKDYTGDLLFQIDTIQFVNPEHTEATAIFNGDQFGAARIDNDVLIEGSNGVNRIVIEAEFPGFDASGWTFSQWRKADKIVILGTGFGDDLTGSSRADVIDGGAGQDDILGGGGADRIIGGLGGDDLDGGAGRDTLDYSWSLGRVVIDLGSNDATGGEATGDDIINFENVTASDYNDNLTGDGGRNRLLGGLGSDTLTGNGGADRFIYTSILQSVPNSLRDRITDFSQADNDRIDLSGLGEIRDLDLVPLRFIGENNFTLPGQVRYVHGGGITIVQVNMDGDHFADFEIGLSGTIDLVQGDFIL